MKGTGPGKQDSAGWCWPHRGLWSDVHYCGRRTKNAEERPCAKDNDRMGRVPAGLMGTQRMAGNVHEKQVNKQVAVNTGKPTPKGSRDHQTPQ